MRPTGLCLQPRQKEELAFEWKSAKLLAWPYHSLDRIRPRTFQREQTIKQTSVQQNQITIDFHNIAQQYGKEHIFATCAGSSYAPPTDGGDDGGDVDGGDGDAPFPSLSELLQTTGLTFLLETLEELNLLDELENRPGFFTFFAPTNDALAIDAGSAQGCPRLLLLSHIVPDARVNTFCFVDGMTLPTVVEGRSLRIDIERGGEGMPDEYVVNNEANIVQSNLFFTNGILHIIDDVLFDGYDA
ncbi:Fasciclin domain-containing protein [Balamuthia mandrillaris]